MRAAQGLLWPVASTPPAKAVDAPDYFACRSGCRWPDGSPVYMTPTSAGWTCEECGGVWAWSRSRLLVHDLMLRELAAAGKAPVRRLAALSGLGLSTVHRHMERLRAAGYIAACPSCGRPFGRIECERQP